MKQFIDFDDMSIPLGKRKVHYVKWLMHKYRYTLRQAQFYCWKKFRHEEAVHRAGMRPAANHYLIVWNRHGHLELLNFSQKTTAYDDVLAEMTKDDYYEIEDKLRGVKTKDQALEIINTVR